MQWIETWMNDASNKIALGVDPSMTFSSCNMEVNQAFALQGDGMHNSAALLPELIDDGVRLLVYAGNAGAQCLNCLPHFPTHAILRRHDVQLHSMSLPCIGNCLLTYSPG
jgi:hypothetical protein